MNDAFIRPKIDAERVSLLCRHIIPSIVTINHKAALHLDVIMHVLREKRLNILLSSR